MNNAHSHLVIGKQVKELADENERLRAQLKSMEDCVLDAERYRKLVFTINYLARIPTKLREFIAVTAGSNKAGIDEIIDELQDFRIKK